MDRFMDATQKAIGFLRNGVHPKHVLAYREILRKKDIDAFAVCMVSRERREYDVSLRVYCFEDYLEKYWNSLDRDCLFDYQKLYDEYNLWEIYYTDRYMRYKYDYNEASKIIVGLIDFWEEIFSSEHVLCLVNDVIIGAYNFIGMIVGKKYNVEYISLPTARQGRNMTFFSICEGWRNEVFERLMRNGYRASQDEYFAAEKYIKDYIEKKREPLYMEKARISDKLSSQLVRVIKKVRKIHFLWDGHYNRPYDTMTYKSQKNVIKPFMVWYRRKEMFKFFSSPDFELDKFILFPLHYQPEASTCVYARKYENQLFFIEQLSKSIPAGLKIYVKEHSTLPGSRALAFYREVQKYPNIKLISPMENIHELIRNATYLVVLTSTAGFEALMYGKPVFVCGDVFYENFSGVRRIHDVFDQKKEFLNPPIQNREEYINQMACYLKTLNICSTVEEQFQEESPENLSRLQNQTIASILKYLEEIHHDYGQFRK